MKSLPKINNIESNGLLIQSFDHTEPEDDDCGIPEDPIFTNYSKYLWKGHSENPRMQKNTKLTEHFNGSKNIK